MSYKAGDKLVTSNDREYVVLGGPFSGNNGSFYVTKNDEGIVEFKTPGLLDTFDGRKKNEKF